MTRPSWQHSNEGKPQGQKNPFTPGHVQAVADQIRSTGNVRDVALWLVMISTALRVSDVVRLRASHVLDSQGNVRNAFRVVQHKLAGENTSITKRKPTHAFADVTLEPAALAALRDYIKAHAITGDTLLFPVSPCRVRQLVKGWCEAIGLQADSYSCHSTRRTAPTLVYAATKDYERCRQILGHTTLRHTSAYLGISRADAMDSKSQALSFLK